MSSIAKRGDIYLRTLLVNGARSAIAAAQKYKKADRKSKWVIQLKEKKGYAKTCIAFANKNVRVIWALLKQNTEYKVAM
ncbi:MAG: hypothetical protein K2X39_08800 [Silvanigrellaceae bacterium]|nr:hypothetical protein [Silvanigrellaceae bacterium]